MKKFLFLLSVLVPSLALAEVDYRYLRHGVSVSPIEAWQAMDSADVARYKAQGFDHLRINARALPKFPRPGKPSILFTQDQLRQVERFYRYCRENGLRLIVESQSWAQEYKRALKEYVEGGRPTYLAPSVIQMARAIRAWNAEDWVVLEPHSELGWWTDTINPMLSRKLNHQQARERCTEYVQDLLDQMVPAAMAACPGLSMLLPGPAFGSPIGPGEWQDLDLSRFAQYDVRYRVHFYGPREITHNGEKGRGLKALKWPDPDNRWKHQVDNPSVASYEFGGLPRNKSSFRRVFQPVIDHFAEQGIKIFVSECGAIGSARQTQAFRAYFRDLTDVLEAMGIGYTEWR